MDRALHRALLAALAAAPEDPAPRQVYADFLEERGDPRAPFFRLDPAEATEAAYEQLIGPVLQDFQVVSAGGPLRGVITSAALSGWVFMKRSEEWLDRFPLSDDLTLMVGYAPPILIAACPALGELRSLGLVAEFPRARLGKNGLRALLGSPHLGRLETLSFHGCALDAPALNLFVKASLPSLRKLFLMHDPRIGAKALRALTRSNRLHLEVLSITHCDLDDDALRSLAAWPSAASLRVLDLSGARASDEAVRALRDSPYLAKLEKLLLATPPTPSSRRP